MHSKHARIRTRFAVTAGGATAGSLPNRKVVPALLTLVLLILVVAACGGAPSNPSNHSNPDPLVEVRVTAGSQLIAVVGDTVPLQAKGGYRSPTGVITYKDVTNSAIWSTSNAAVATVNKGVVTGTGVGTATISATFGGKSGSTSIFVELTVAINISPVGPFSLSAGSSITFHATELLPDGSTVDVSGPAFWDSSNSAVVSIYPLLGGEATLVATGTTTITATMGTGEVGSLDVTVVP
jgi:hypothetical protein